MSMITIQDIERIEKYLEGKLSGNELSDFKRDLANNPELASTTESFKYALEGVQLYNRQQLKSQLDQIQKEVKPLAQPMSKALKFGLVATGVVLVAGLFFILKPTEKKSTEAVNEAISIVAENQTAASGSANTELETEELKLVTENTSTTDNNNPIVENSEATTASVEDISQQKDSEKVESLTEVPKNRNAIENDNNKAVDRRSDDIPIVDFVIDHTSGCQPLAVQFKDESSIENGKITKWYWEFGDGHTSNSPNPKHNYTKAGNYHVKLSVWSDNGNTNYLVKENLAKVFMVPQVSFEATPSIVIENNPDVSFLNKTTNAPAGTRYSWDFGDNMGSSDKKDPSYRYADTGSYIVSLTATTSNKCVDHASRGIIVVPLADCFLPTAFSPDGKGPSENNNYKVVAEGFTEFQIVIYSRYGEVVYSSKDYKAHGWDGNYQHQSPQHNEAEIFVVKVRLTGFDGKEYNFRQSITLIR
jgi:PKD repeat protein